MKNQELLNKYLRGEATLAEKNQLAEMLDDFYDWNPQLMKVWSQSDGEMPSGVDKRVKNNIRSRIIPRRRNPWLIIWNIAASVALFVVGVWAFAMWSDNLPGRRYADSTVEVGRGQRTEMTLPDGTHVSLNSDSKLTYGQAFNRSRRIVKLQGEAFFDVAKDMSSPFSVDLGGVTVQATGTSFNISSYNNEKSLTVFLASGSVKVNSSAETITLMPGEVAEYNRTTRKLLKETGMDTEQYIGWKNNQLILDNKSLEEVIRQLERNFNVRFNILNEEIKQNKYSGTLKTNSLHNALELMCITSNLRYAIRNDEIDLYSK